MALTVVKGRFVTLLLAVACCLSSCKQKTATTASVKIAETPTAIPALEEVVVKQMTAEGQGVVGVHFDDVALAKSARDQIEKAAIFATPKDIAQNASSPKANVLFAYAVEDVRAEGKALARVVAKLKVGIKPAKNADPYWGEDVEASGEMPYAIDAEGKPSQKAFVFLVSKLSTDLLSDYVARQKLRTAPEEEIIGRMKSDGDMSLRDEAIRLAGERKLAKAVAPLLSLLTDENEMIRDAALGALLAMQEQRAVAVLAASRSMRDRREMRKVVEAIALLGGNEAVSYLEFVADSNEDEELRGLAKRSLERLRKR
jgi:hypothetical protein